MDRRRLVIDNVACLSDDNVLEKLCEALGNTRASVVVGKAVVDVKVCMAERLFSSIPCI